jgi:hypothetical protein
MSSRSTCGYSRCGRMQMVGSSFAREYPVSVAGADYEIEGRKWWEYIGDRESR